MKHVKYMYMYTVQANFSVSTTTQTYNLSFSMYTVVEDSLYSQYNMFLIGTSVPLLGEGLATVTRTIELYNSEILVWLLAISRTRVPSSALWLLQLAFKTFES